MNNFNQTRGSKRTRKPEPFRELTVNSYNLDEVKTFVHRLPGIGIPDRMFANLAYDQDNLALVSAAATGTQVFSGNSCFDPDTTGVGHQPFYFDQFSQFYNRYRVHKSMIVFELLSSTIGSHITITPTTDGTWPTSVQSAMEIPYTCSIPVSSSVFRTVKDRSISTKKIWGIQSITQDDLYQALYTASPTRQWYWRIQAISFDGTTNVTIRANVRVVYEVEFFDKYPIGSSLNSEMIGGSKCNRIDNYSTSIQQQSQVDDGRITDVRWRRR